jgi:hypothetical protein
MRRTPFGWFTILLGLFVVLSATGIASARQGGTVFYLTLHPRQCVATSVTATTKSVVVVPCANPSHKMEIYALGHGGWGHKTRPPSAYSIARSVCLTAFSRLTGHTLGPGFGWWAFWPDPGSETARFGDKIICGLRTYPQFSALGRGWHVR